MIQLFTIRLQRKRIPLNLINKTLNAVKYEFRLQYLKQKEHKEQIPYIFKILYTKQTDHKYIRNELNNFTSN